VVIGSEVVYKWYKSIHQVWEFLDERW
jgi:hypothetical protein